MAIYGVRSKYEETDCATIQVRKLKNKTRQNNNAAAVIPVMIEDGRLTYGEYSVHLLWEE